MSHTHPLPGEFLTRPIRIHVAGCGGNGAQVLHCLARLHKIMVELEHPGGLEVVAWDPDHVSPANNGRQLFFPADLGHNKAAVLITRLNCSLNLRWEAVDRAWEPQGVVRPFAPGLHALEFPDVLITCVDTAKARWEIHRALHASTGRIAYWLDLGNLQRHGQVWLGEPPTIWRKNDPRPRLPVVTEMPWFPAEGAPEDNQPSCSVAEAVRRQSPFINDWIAREAVELLERFLRNGKIDYHGVFVNRETGEHPRQPIPGPAGEKVRSA